MRMIGFVLFIFGIVMMMFVASEYRVGDMATFIDSPTIAFFGFILAGTVIVTGSGKTFLSGINGILSRKYQMTDEQREKAVALFKLLGKVTALASIVSAFIGIILTMLNLNSPGMLGTTVGVALLAVFWGAVIQMLFIQPAVYLLSQTRETEPEPARAARIKDKQALEKLAQLCFEKGLTYEDIMEADDIQLRKYQ